MIMLATFLCTACPAPELNPAKYAAPTPEEIKRTPGDSDEMKLTPHHREELADTQPSTIDATPEITGKELSLAELVDIGLRNSPTTRIAWAEARASAANWGISRSDYYPSLDATAAGAAGKISPAMGGKSYVQLGAELNYLLLDFGARSAKAESARQALIAANWNHNQAIQDLLRDVPTAFYNYIGSRAQVVASEKNLLEAETSLRSTEERKKSGVSTISDVLKARAAAANIRSQLASYRGQVKIDRGQLATTIGWPANTPFEVARAPGKLPLNDIGDNVNELVEEAKSSRPELSAAQALVRQKEADFLKSRTMPFPKISGTGNYDLMMNRDDQANAYYGGLNISIPIFHGFEMENSIRAARAELDAARSKLKLTEENIIQEVWNAYHNFGTSMEQLKANREMLTSASESFDASLARYRAGAADIVELLDAQSTLADARSQLIEARNGLFISYAELIHAVGEELPDAQSIDERDIAYGQD